MPGPALSYGPNHYSAEDAAAYVSLTYINNCVLYATACLLAYEWVTSLDDEVNRIWTLKWRLPKFLFMLNRYIIRAILIGLWIVADFPNTSAEFCRIYAYWQMIPLRLAILAAQGLVVIRVWAIYNNSRPMFWVLATLYTLEVVAVATCVIVATMNTQGVAQPAPLSCALISMSGDLLQDAASGTWIAPVCFEFVMVLITLVKLVPRWSFGKQGWLGTGGNATLDILARDSLIYFGFIFTFTLTNAIIYELSFSAHYHAILLSPTSAVSCIAVSRMMINMRSLPSSPLAHPTSTLDAYARPDLSFGELPTDMYDAGGIPDTARTAYFDSSRAAGGGGYFELPHSGYGPSMPRPGSARTSGDATQVGDGEAGSEMGSMIEMGLRKVL